MKKLSDFRILLVDDAKANLDILVEGLKGDYKLSLALHGEMALQVAERMPPDLVLLDIMMPGLDGYEVCRRLRARPETADTPIMFLSSLEDVGDKTRGFEVGANDYLTKPFELLEVKARVRSLLKAKAYSDAVKEQMASELQIAREIQMGMLPGDFTALEETYGVKLGAVLEPAREVGGDLYGVCAAGPDRFVLFLGDVSGKGIPASMFMVRAISLARLLAREIADPGLILVRLNDELAVDNPSNMFVTFQCAVFEPATGRLTIANAGHCKPVLLPADGGAPRWAVERLGTALGFEPGLVFECTEVTLRPGDRIIFYSDGVSEAFNHAQECYGNERLLADSAKLPGPTPPRLAAALLDRVRAHADGAPQSDDIAILVLAAGRARDAEPLRLELAATSAEVMRAVEALRGFGAQQGLEERALFGLTVALEECASNIVNHALADRPGATFTATFCRVNGGLVLELRDGGPAFDPTAVPERKPQAEDDDEPGGWGVHLIRRYTDAIEYAREGHENVLRLIKQLESPPPPT